LCYRVEDQIILASLRERLTNPETETFNIPGFDNPVKVVALFYVEGSEDDKNISETLVVFLAKMMMFLLSCIMSIYKRPNEVKSRLGKSWYRRRIKSIVCEQGAGQEEVDRFLD